MEASKVIVPRSKLLWLLSTHSADIVGSRRRCERPNFKDMQTVSKGQPHHAHGVLQPILSLYIT